jgi:hypothetical protein
VKEAAIHGGSRIFSYLSEDIAYHVRQLTHRNSNSTADFGLKALGEFSWEKCSPLPKGTYAGKTVIIGGDDDLWFRRTSNFIYSENGDADLENGKYLF